MRSPGSHCGPEGDDCVKQEYLSASASLLVCLVLAEPLLRPNRDDAAFAVPRLRAYDKSTAALLFLSDPTSCLFIL